jgi:hypothetical protein
MHKISRAYVANAGYRLAWYDGLLLEFTDEFSGQPTHTIYNLVNQGGKTTFLSLLFSCIRTRSDEFLQHLSNPAQRFEDYFDRDGLPGIIALEWLLPGDLATPVRTVVTAQLVCRRAHESNAERWFFLMQGKSDDFGLDYIPGPNLSGPPEQVLHNRDAVIDWLQKTRSACGEQAFFYTQNQTEWEKALRAVGLDVDLLRQQVEFNRKEGSMDDAFLSFRDEREFIRRFLTLTLPNEYADQVREAVAEQCRRLARRKPLKDSLSELQRFEAVFAPFAAEAREHSRAMLEESRTQIELAVAEMTLRVRQEEHQRLRETFHSLLTEHEGQARAAAERALSAERQAVGAQYALFARALARADAAVKKTEEDLEALHEQGRYIEAATSLLTLRQCERALDEVKEALRKASGALEPLRRERDKHGAKLREGLRVAVKCEVQAAAALREKLDELGGKLQSLTAERAIANGGWKQATAAHALVTTKLKQANDARARLVRDKLLDLDEPVDEATERHETRRRQTDAELGTLAARRRTVSEELGRLATERDEHLGQRERTRAERDLVGESLQRARQQQESLARNEVLCRAVGADSVDLDSESLPGELSAHLRRLQEDASEAQLQCVRLGAEMQHIEANGLAGYDADVMRTLRALLDKGVKGAQPFTHYLARVLPKAEEARAVVQSDPGRYLGICVHTPEQLEKARATLTDPSVAPKLVRPVVVSCVADTPAPDAPERFTVGPQDDSLYNLEAARRLASQLVESLDDATRRRNETREALKQAHGVENELTRYCAEFGGPKLRALAEAFDAVEQSYRTAQEALDACTTRRAALQAELEDIEVAAKAATTMLQGCERALSRLLEYSEDHESQRAQREEEYQAQQSEVLTFEALLLKYEERDAALRKEERTANLAFDQHEARSARLKSEHDLVTDFDCKFEATRELAEGEYSLQSLRDSYELARATLAAAEQRDLAGLALRKEHCEQAHAQAHTASTQAAAGLLDARVHAVSLQDLDALRADVGTKQERLAHEKAAQLGQQGEARARLDDYARTHPHAEQGAEVFSSMEDEPLLARHEELQESARRHREAQEAANRAGEEAKTRLEAYATSARQFADAAKFVRGYATDPAPAPSTAFSDAQHVMDEVSALLQAHEYAQKRTKKHHDAAGRCFQKVSAFATSETFERTDVELAQTLRRNQLDEALIDYERVENAIVQRRESIESDLREMDGDFERAVGELLQLVDMTVKLLQKATTTLTLPDHVPRVAGRTVLRMPRILFGLTREMRRERLGPMLERMAADGNVPENGSALATAAVLELGQGRLGLQLLKVVETAEEQYVPVEKLSRSGAESISMAMLLYFVIARLRNEAYGQQAQRMGSGVLILDNPFSKATSRPVWEIIVGLADAMDLQLVLATAVQDAEPLSVFRRFLRLARGGQHSGTGRIHVRVADYNFKPQAVQA